jgi:hypothetical protein
MAPPGNDPEQALFVSGVQEALASRRVLVSMGGSAVAESR